jgi:hypothetical protein
MFHFLLYFVQSSHLKNTIIFQPQMAMGFDTYDTALSGITLPF